MEMAALMWWCSSPRPWIFSLIFFFFFTSGLFADPLTYSDHCDSFVPQATPELYSIAADTLPFYQQSLGYYNGGNPIFKDSSSTLFTFQTLAVQKTDREGVVKVDAELVFLLSETSGSSSGPDTGYISIPQPGTVTYHSSNDQTKRKRESVSFRLEGFWSASSGRLCMLGSSYVAREEYDFNEDLKLKAVLKLTNVFTSSSITNVITGKFEALHTKFDPISMLMFPQKNYSYTLLDPQISDASKTNVNLDRNSACFLFNSWDEFYLKYTDDCDSAKIRNLFEGSNLLPTMVPYVMGCDSSTQLRVLLQFSNQSSSRRRMHSISFEPKTALIAEGFWDEKKKLLRFDACRISVPESSPLSDARVEDCSISFLARFPTVWSIQKRDSIVGEIKSKKSSTESGYFSKITAGKLSRFRRYDPVLKYEYSQIDRVTALCPDRNHSGSVGTYPSWYSNDLSFRMILETSRGKKIGEGYSSPLFVGDQVYRSQYHRSKKNAAPIIQGKPGKNSKLRVSYTMTISKPDKGKVSSGSKIFNGAYLSLGDTMEISAEGVYDGAKGSLCMIGCRRLVDSMDCELVIKLQFPPLKYANKARDSIKGSIESLRKRSDPLYFDSLRVTSDSLYEDQSAASIWKLDSKLTVVLLSSTLSCIFAAWQLFHAKKHPHAVPFASQLMFMVLILGHAIPLMLNFDTSFQDMNWFGYLRTEASRWIQNTEVLVRMATLLALLFELHLLQLTFSATTRNPKSLVAEKKALILSLPLYALLALAAIFINRSCTTNTSVWYSTKRFAGVVHSGFLLPQILVNTMTNSRDKILSVPFYVGTTLISVMPYGYDLWNNGSFVSISDFLEGLYQACDVMIPFGSLVFAAIVYVQQRFGGRCLVPRRFRNDAIADEKVSLITVDS